MSVTGSISILYTCIFDIPWHAQGVMHLQAPSGSAQTMTLANLSLRLTMGPAEDAQSSEVPEPVPGKPESPPKTLSDAKVRQDLHIILKCKCRGLMRSFFCLPAPFRYSNRSMLAALGNTTQQ